MIEQPYLRPDLILPGAVQPLERSLLGVSAARRVDIK